MHSLLNYSQPINWGHPLNRGLVGRWQVLPHRFGGGGLRLRDLTRRHDGTLTNGPTWQGAIGRRGGSGALATAGVGYVNAGTNAVLNVTTGDFTFGFWVKYTGTGAVGFPLCRTTGASTNGYDLILGRGNNTGMASLRLNGGAGPGIDLDASGVWNDGVWHFMVTGRASNELFINIDGTSRGTLSDITRDLTNASAPLNFYARNNSVFFTGGGSGDDWFVYPTRALSASEIFQLYEDSLRGSPATLNWISTARVFDIGVAVIRPAARTTVISNGVAVQSSSGNLLIGGGIHA